MLFPGMDPYLEDPHLWPGVHARLVVYISDNLQARLPPRYICAIEERAIAMLEADIPVVVRMPEVEVHQRYITILDRGSDNRLVTVIEVVGKRWLWRACRVRQTMSTATRKYRSDLGRRDHSKGSFDLEEQNGLGKSERSQCPCGRARRWRTCQGRR